MLIEQKTVQTNDQFKRRWFSNEYFDLIIWEDEHGEIDQFELCYDIKKHEHTLCWGKENGYKHLRVDDGEIAGSYKMSPIFVPDGYFDNKLIVDKFTNAAKSIDQKVAEFIRQKILAFEL